MMFPYIGILSREEFLLTRENAYDLLLTLRKKKKKQT